MPTYISLLRYTQQGIEKVKDSADRVDAARQAFQSMGGNLKTLYLVMGQYDLVTIFEAPDDETAAKLGLALCSRGNVRSETLRAFTEDEFRQIIADLP